MKVVYTFLLMLTASLLFSQTKRYNQSDVIQFTGKVVTADDNGDIIALPYVNVAVMGTSRGAVSENDGYFSFVAVKGERVIFSRIGFKSVEYTVPDTLSGDYYSWIQIMSTDNVLLPEMVIYPWPSREHFKQDLLAMDISNDLLEQAQKNLASNALRELRNTIPTDGREGSLYTFRQTADAAVYNGQFKPQKIFDVFAWKKFIEAWKRGDFKKKKKTDN